MPKLKQFLKRIPYWLKFAVEFMILYWTIFYAHDLFFTGHDNYLSMVLALFVFPVAFLVYDLPPWIKIIAYFLDLLVLGSIIGLIIQIIKSKIKKITTKSMPNNQIQPTNQIKFNRFHLKTWQWLSILIIVAVIVGGVFAFFGLKERPSNGEPLRICSQNSDCYFTCDYGCINKEFKHKDKSLCNMPPGSCECINNECQFVEDVSWRENFIKNSIQQANYCQTADDCVLLGEYCPFSNSWETYVNKAEKDKIQRMIEDSQKKAPPISCEPSICNNISPVQCVEGKCYVACRDSDSQANCGRAVKKETCNLINGCVWSNQQCQTIAAAIDEQQSAEQQITITTDKTEYEQEETVKITIKNNLDKTLYYGGDGGIERYENGQWTIIEHLWECPCEVRCEEEFQHRPLYSYKSAEFTWDQMEESCQGLETIKKQVTLGKYRIQIKCYFINGERESNTIYSNEFTIKEKQALIPQTKESCEAKGGQWGKWGLKPPEAPATCNLPTTDAGKECSGSNECEGDCIAELNEEQKDVLNKTDEPVYTKGQCSAVNIVVGCHAYVINGKVEGILCAD